VAGKIHTGDVREVLDRGIDIAVLGWVAILHQDNPVDSPQTRRSCPVDPRFRPRHRSRTVDVAIESSSADVSIEML